VSRIVFVSPEGALFTIDPATGELPRPLMGGSGTPSGAAGRQGPRRVNFDVAYAWPTWSPDGAKLAVSQVRVLDGQAEMSIQAVEAATGRSRALYTNSAPGMVAEGSPHYLYWSPDSRSLAFLAPSAEGLALLVQDLDPAAGGPVMVAQGAPLFFQWASDSRALLLHHSEDLLLVQRPFDDPASRRLLAAGQGYRTPAFSPDAQRIAYASPTPAGASVMAAQLTPRFDPQPLLAAGSQCAFAWSPDGRELAVADQEDSNVPGFARLRIVPAAGGPARTVTTEPMLAFFWAPDGRRIAWIGLDLSEQRFECKVAPTVPPLPAPAQSLFRFQPSADLFTMLSFFDQYAYSHSLWSPDGARLVVTGTRQMVSARRNGHTPSGDKVYLLDASAAAEPRELGYGSLAFWEWK